MFKALAIIIGLILGFILLCIFMINLIAKALVREENFREDDCE